MSGVKWIKITTNIFDDEKIRLIDAMPENDAIIVIWFKLLVLAGKVNENGALFLNDKLAYTDEMLATVFNRKINTVRLALQILEDLGMIEVEEFIQIANWSKHQSVEGMEKIKEQNRVRQQRFRDKQNIKEIESDSNVTHNVTVTQPSISISNSSSYSYSLKDTYKDTYKEEEKNKEKEKKELTQEKKEDVITTRFELFWKHYPRKVGKGKVVEWFKKNKPSQKLLDEMVVAIKEQSQSSQWQEEKGRFIPNPSTWLNQGRWQDELGVEIKPVEDIELEEAIKEWIIDDE